MISPAAEAPSNLYQENDIVPTDEYKPFTKKLLVCDITLIGRDDISDDFMRKVAKTRKEMFPQDESIDDVLQKEVLSKLSLSEEDSHSLTMKILRFVKGLKQNCKLVGGKQNLIFLIIQNK